MRKEVLFAVISGVVFGLVIAFGIWKANSSMEKTSNITIDSIASNEGVDNPLNNSPDSLSITLAKPDDNVVVGDDVIEVSGLTKPDSWINITSEVVDYVIKSTSDGSFKQEVELESGVNQIALTVFDDDGNSATEDVIVVYSTEFSNE